MAKLNVHVFNDDGKTVSKFEVSNTERVAFINHGAAELTIVVKDSPMPGPVLCKKRNNKQPVTSFPVPANSKEALFICDAYQGDSFTYSAQIENTVIEDPIIIIEKASHFGSIAASILPVAAGLGAGIVLTLVAVRLFRKFRPT